MTFRELRLPSSLNKKKKLSLYKCWILEPLDPGSDIRSLNINMNFDRFGLTEEAAFDAEFQRICHDEWKEDSNRYISNGGDDDGFIKKAYGEHIVIMEIVLRNGIMDEEIIQLPPNSLITTGVDYDPTTMTLNATIGDRYVDMHMFNYQIKDMNLEYQMNTDTYEIKDLKWEPSVISRSVTGG